MDGKRVLEGKAIEDIDFDGTGADASTPRRPAAFASLTDREFEVAELIARGLDNKEIAAAAYMGRARCATTSARSLPKWAYATARRSPSPTCEGNYPTTDHPGIAKWLLSI